MEPLVTNCPYRKATVSSCSEGACQLQINNTSNLIVLKGEIVRDIFLNMRKMNNIGNKAADYILIKTVNATFKFILVEMSLTLHKPSILESKFKNSLLHLEQIINCEEENINNYTVKLIVAYKKVRSSSQFQHIFKRMRFNFFGKDLVLRNVKCGNLIEV